MNLALLEYNTTAQFFLAVIASILAFVALRLSSAKKKTREDK